MVEQNGIEGEEEKKERKRSKSEKTERRRRRDKDNGRFKPKEFSAADLDSGEKISIKMIISMITSSLSPFSTEHDYFFYVYFSSEHDCYFFFFFQFI